MREDKHVTSWFNYVAQAICYLQSHCICGLSSLPCWNTSRNIIWLLTLSCVRVSSHYSQSTVLHLPFLSPPIPMTHFLLFFIPECKCRSTSKAYACYIRWSPTGQRPGFVKYKTSSLLMIFFQLSSWKTVKFSSLETVRSNHIYEAFVVVQIYAYRVRGLNTS